MKIFYAIQVSNTTMVERPYGETSIKELKWLLGSDAVFQIDLGISKCIMDARPDVKFMFKIPTTCDVTGWKDYDQHRDGCSVKPYFEFFEPKYHDRIAFYHEPIPLSPVNSRFSFLFNYHYHNSRFFNDCDVMINDENTLTKNWNVLFKSLGLNIPIISTNYFLDSPISNKVPTKLRYYERQMESFMNSDIAAFQCEACRREAKEAFELLFKPSFDEVVKSSIWGVGAHAAEIEAYKTTDRFPIPTVYFGNRITDTANRYNNWHIFAKAIGEAARHITRDFDAIVLNPSRKITDAQISEILTLSNGKVKIIPNDSPNGRKEYLEFINKADISCNLFTNEVHGGVTHAEAMLAENITIMPKINNYADKFEAAKIEYPFFCGVEKDKSINMESLIGVIVQAVNCIGTDAEKRWKKTCRDVAYEYESYEKAAGRIIADIDFLINKGEKA